MSRRGAGRIAWLLCGMTLAMIGCALALAVPNRYGFENLTFLLTEASAALVGGLVASRQPRNPVGWLIVGHALFFTLGEFGRQYAIYGVLTNPGSLPLAGAMASFAYWAWFPGLILMMSLLPLYFPSGRLLSSRWRPVYWFTISSVLIITSMTAVRPASDETRGIPNPLGIEALKGAGVFEVIVPALWSVLAAVSAVSLVLRFRRARGEERQQIKWVAYAVVMLIFFNILNQLLPQNLPLPWSEILFTFSLELLWVSVAVAIFRYRLYDIDVVINRTLVYGVLTLSLILIYLGGVVLLQTALRALSGQESSLAVVASTLLISALFNPLRRRIQNFIDRRFYRGKYDAARVLATLSGKLRDETDLERLSEDLLVAVRETMQPGYASLWLRPLPGRSERHEGGSGGV